MSSLAFPASWGRRDGVRPHAPKVHRKAQCRGVKPTPAKYRTAHDWPESTDAVVFGPIDAAHRPAWTDSVRVTLHDTHHTEGDRP